MEWRKRITSDPKVCHGQACIAGTRIMVSVLLGFLAGGETIERVAEAYEISQEDVRAALAYAAELARELVVDLAPTGSGCG